MDEKRMTKIMDYYMELCCETNKLQTSFSSTFFIVFDLGETAALFKRHMAKITQTFGRRGSKLSHSSIKQTTKLLVFLTT